MRAAEEEGGFADAVQAEQNHEHAVEPGAESAVGRGAAAERANRHGKLRDERELVAVYLLDDR